jgi:TolA-binding protein
MHSAKGIASSTDHGNDSQNDSFGASSNSMFTHQQSIDQQRTVDQMRLQQQHIQQQQEHRLQQIDHQNEARDIVAEPLDKILENKLVREKREAMEKKLKSLKKNHDKEKMKAITQKCGDVSDKKSKFYMGNKLVKRLSSKNMYVFLLLSFISFILFTRCFFFQGYECATTALSNGTRRGRRSRRTVISNLSRACWHVQRNIRKVS